MNNFNINTKVNPKGLKKDEYDVIIIGAGIGGLHAAKEDDSYEEMEAYKV